MWLQFWRVGRRPRLATVSPLSLGLGLGFEDGSPPARHCLLATSHSESGSISTSRRSSSCCYCSSYSFCGLWRRGCYSHSGLVNFCLDWRADTFRKWAECPSSLNQINSPSTKNFKVIITVYEPLSMQFFVQLLQHSTATVNAG